MQNFICANNIEFIFTIVWEASVSPGEKTTLKFSSSCFSLNDHSGFKLETAEINKQAKEKKKRKKPTL